MASAPLVYIRSRTVEDARRELADRRRVRIDPEHAKAFYAALDDASPVPELQRLADVGAPDLSRRPRTPVCVSSR